MLTGLTVTLDQMKMLVQIADTGSIQAAADKLGRTQPTISVGIRKLEEELGVTLLARDHYRSQLTGAGAALCRQAREVLRQVEVFAALSRQLALGNEPELRIAIEASCPMPLALAMLKSCEQRFPGTEFILLGETLWGALERLHKREVDIAVTPWFKEDSSLESCPLTTATLITVASPDFPPRARAGKLTLDDLRSSVQVAVKDSSRNPPESNFGRFEGSRHWHVSDHQAKKEILLAGLGWGRLHVHMIEQELQDGRLVPLDIVGYPQSFEVEIRMARRQGEVIGPVAQAFWEEARNCAVRIELETSKALPKTSDQ